MNCCHAHCACSHDLCQAQEKKTSAIGVHGKGSVASVTRIKRPRAGSHQRMILLTALSSFPLSEPSLKELHTRRAPPGLGQNVRPHARPVVRNEQSPHVDVKRTFNIRVHTCPHLFLPMACQALPSEACRACTCEHPSIKVTLTSCLESDDHEINDVRCLYTPKRNEIGVQHSIPSTSTCQQFEPKRLPSSLALGGRIVQDRMRAPSQTLHPGYGWRAFCRLILRLLLSLLELFHCCSCRVTSYDCVDVAIFDGDDQ